MSFEDRFLDYEEDFHERSQKRKRPLREVKQKSSKPQPSSFLRGRVLGVYPEGIKVDSEGKEYRCRLRGSLKMGKQTAKTLVTIGDFVLFEPDDASEGTIFEVEPRRSILSRADNLLRRQEQLIAANIDLVLITASCLDPPLKPSLLDRYLIAAQKGNMESVIVINKIDLLSEDGPDREALYELRAVYEQLSIPFLLVSAQGGEGLEALKKVMQDKISVFSGQSGTGKTSLINALVGTDLRTGSLTEKTRKGAHTTTSSSLLPLIEGRGFCIDTPGVRSFGLWDLEAEEVESYFSEIAKEALKCKFPSCSHDEEAGCSVQVALEEGRISPYRFSSYLTLLRTLQEEHRHR